jgi:hypothetical protein
MVAERERDATMGARKEKQLVAFVSRDLFSFTGQKE